MRSEEEEEEGEEEGEEKEEEEEREKMEWGGLVSCHDKHLPLTVLPLYSLLPSERQAEVCGREEVDLGDWLRRWWGV